MTLFLQCYMLRVQKEGNNMTHTTSGVKTYGYVRVSTVQQNEARQLEALKSYKLDNTYIDKASAKDMNRPQWNELKQKLKSGDRIVIHSLDRVSRSTMDLLNLIDELETLGIELISIKDNIDTATPMGKFMLTVLSAVNQLERDNMLERQAEGIAEAKKQGKYKGRQRIEADATFNGLYESYLNGKIQSKTKLAQLLNISRPTLYRMISEYEAKNSTEA